jgi:hypothetical protein
MANRYFIAMIAAFGIVSAPANLSAQSTLGTVRGTTMDQSGAVLVGAQVTLHSVDENTNLASLAGIAVSREASNSRDDERETARRGGHNAASIGRERAAPSAMESE